MESKQNKIKIISIFGRGAVVALGLSLSILFTSSLGVSAQENNSGPVSAPAYWQWAPTPPMGWNSWDCFGTTVTEAQTKAQADFMAAKLKPHGWQYIVVDIQWYQPTATGHDYKEGAKLAMDGFSRLVPAPENFHRRPAIAGSRRSPIMSIPKGLSSAFT